MSDQKSFAKAPYYDDYRRDSGFLKVLFKPGYPVQARELNQIQSILQNQINTMGEHFFKEGSMVIPGGVSISPETFFGVKSITKRISSSISEYTEELKISDLDISGKFVVNSNDVEAKVIRFHFDESNQRSLISLSYTSSGKNGERDFLEGDIVTFSYEDDGVTTAYEFLLETGEKFKSKGLVAKSLKGVFYVRGYFVHVDEETIVIDPYSQSPSKKIGYLLVDKIVTSSDDESLYENASGFNNIGVSGADRYVLDMQLTSIDISYDQQGTNKDFLPMIYMENGVVKSNVEKTTYSHIKDEIKRYHKEVYGNYIVNHFISSVSELSSYIDEKNGFADVGYFSFTPSDIYSEDYSKTVVKNQAVAFFGVKSNIESDYYFRCTLEQQEQYGVYGFKLGTFYALKDPKTLLDSINSHIRFYLGSGKVSLDGEVFSRDYSTSLLLKKPEEFEYKNNVNVPINYGNYVYITEANKIPSIGEKLYFSSSNTAVDDITTQFPSYTFNHTRNTVNCFDLIGEAIVTGVEYFSGNPGYGWNKHIPCSDATNYWHALAGAGETTRADRVSGEQGVHRGTFSIAGYEPVVQRGIYKVYITIPEMYTWEQVNDKTRQIISTAINAQSYIYDKSFEAEPTIEEINSGSVISQIVNGELKLNYKTADLVVNDFEFMRKQKVPVEFIRGYYTSFQTTTSNSKLEGSRGTVLTKYIIKNDTQPTINKLHNVVIPRSVDGIDYQHGRIYHHSGNMILVKHLYDITSQQMWSDEKDGVYEAMPNGDIGEGGIRTNLALLKSYKNRLYTPGEKLFVKNYSTTAMDVADFEVHSREIFCDTANTTRLFETGRKYLKSLKPTFNINGVDVKMPDTSYYVQRTMTSKIITRSNGDIGVEFDLNNPDETFAQFNGTNWTVFLASAGTTVYLESIPVEIVQGSISYENAGKKVFFKVYMPGSGSNTVNKQIMDTATQLGYDIVANLTIFKTATERTKTRKSDKFICATYEENFGYSVPSGLTSVQLEEFKRTAAQTYFSEVDLGKADIIKVTRIFEIAPPTSKELSELVDDFGNPTTDTRFQKIIKDKTTDAEGNISNVYTFVKDSSIDDLVFAYNEYRAQVSAAELGELVDNNGNPVQPTATKILDITSNFSLDNGQRPDLYDFGSVKLLKGKPIPVGRVIGGFEYYEHGQGDYFTIDSYSEGSYLIPLYSNESLADFIDFRPVMKRNSKGFIDNLNTPCNNESLLCDAEYYLGKIYKVIAYEQKDFGSLEISLLEGKSHPTSPVSPITPDNAIWLYEIEMRPRVDSLKDIKITQNKEKIKKTVDLTNLERRVSNLEYYISISAAENESLMKKIVDIDGVERFKTGIFVESFSDHSKADTEHPDYHCSIDPINGILRPSFYQDNINLELDRQNSTNVHVRDNIITLNHREIKYSEQTWATRTINVNPFGVITFEPSLKLYPSSDDWKDTETLPVKVINQDLTVPGLDQLTQFIGTQWGDWRTSWVGVDTNIQQNTQTTSSLSPNGWDGSGVVQTTNTAITTTTTVTTTTDSIRNGLAMQAGERTQVIDMGETVVNVTDIPFIRARPISVVVTGFKPNSNLFSFFDKTDVTGLVVPSPYIETTITEESFSSIDVGKIYTITQTNGKIISFEILHAQWVNNISKRARLHINILSPDDQSIKIPLGSRVFERGQPSQLCSVLSYESNYVDFVNGKWISPHDLSRLQNDVNYGTARTDSSGLFVGIFYIPNEDSMRFRCGERTFMVADSNTLSDASLIATSKYTAYGTVVVKQATHLSTRSSTLQQISVQDSMRVVTSTSSSTTQRSSQSVQLRAPNPMPPPPPPPPPPAPFVWCCWRPGDPIAQTFFNERDCSITSFDVFFAKKPKEFTGSEHITGEIRPVVNGYPSATEVLSSVVLLPDQIQVDDFGRKATKFKFDVPVFCKGGQEYAIVLKAPTTTDYEVFICQIGEQLIGQLGIADKQPSLGSLFVSQNQFTWSAEQTRDLKYNLYCADYSFSQGVVYLYDDQTDFQMKRLDYVDIKENQLEIYLPDGGTQYLLRVNHQNHGLFIGDKAELSNLPSNKIGDFTSGNYIDLSKLNGVALEVVDVSNKWYSTYIPSQVIFGTPPQGTINLINPIKSAKNKHYNMVLLNGTYIAQSGTDIDVELKTISGRSYHAKGQIPYIKQQWKKTDFNKEEFFPIPQMIASETNRKHRFDSSKTSFWDGQSLVYRISLSTRDRYVTPVLDIERLSAIIVGNYVNNPQQTEPTLFPEIGYVGDLESGFVKEFVSELEPSGGSVLNKYITKPIKTQFPNVGLNIYATYIQTEANQVRFFIRTSNSSDRTSFEDLPWTELVINNAKVGTKMEVDMVYEAPAEFNAYQIKITMAASNSSSVPIIDDFRCTALGT